MNEVEKFLEDTNVNPMQVDVLEQPLVPAEESEKTTGEESDSTESGEGAAGASNQDDLKPRTRRERRLMTALASERESASFLAGKLQARTEAERSLTEESDYLKGLEQIFGNEKPEAILATDLLKKAIVGAREDAETRAYERIREEQHKAAEEQREAESELDSMIEEIEDEYGVSLTDAQETAFFTLLGKMSPKDRNGSVIEYADPHAVWEVFTERLKKSTGSTRAKDLSSRSMVSSGTSTQSNLQDDTAARFLSEQGII